MSLSEKIGCDCGCCRRTAICIDDIKQYIKEVIEKGEILKNGCFVINYKEFKELVGEDLI